ncbi:putative transporter-1 [Coleophoma cylindrospora]|uniref:Putative transporter-1 n=1 Tax=Coleophoma cylindrospora TaxID=1849047 RepID=A0A3D8RUP6_9HELO|nr:putative transporter-1 [Coleophoma cylindrospora]
MAPLASNESAINAVDVAPTLDIEMAPTGPPTTTGLGVKEDDPFLVAFSPSDRRNPLNWTTSRKWAVTDILSATGFNRIMVSTIMAPALPLIAQDLDMNSTEAAMALSIYLLATAFGPLAIGPLSEIYGRKRILHLSNVWFLVWNIACGFATTKGLLIAARFLAGFGASAIYSLAGGVLGDVWRPEQRGRSLSVYLLIPLLGAAVGPIIGGFMAARTTWRWIFWATSIFQAVMILVSFTAFHETYGPYILQKEARQRRHETGDQRYQTLHERLHTGQSSSSSIFLKTLTRPLRLLSHPIIQVSAIISAFDYGLLYIVLSSFSSLWTDEYGQSVEISGLHYIACALGEVAGSQLGGVLMDRLFVYMRARSSTGDEHAPEARIPLTFLGASLAPIGFLIYGWTAQYHVHWAVVDTGIFIALFGMQIAGMPMQAYVIDLYVEHTSSALAALQFLRSLTAFLFPLFTPSMYRALGYGWGNNLIAFCGIFILFPAPLIIWIYGARLRAKAVSSY